MPRRFDDNEGPSAEDLQEFNREEGDDVYCPECGAVISDLAVMGLDALVSGSRPTFAGSAVSGKAL